MAEVIGSVSATEKQSIARVELFTDANLAQADWILRIYFENALYDGGGALVAGSQRFGSRIVERRFSQIAGQSFTAGGVTATGAQMAALLQAAIYVLRAEDIR